MPAYCLIGKKCGMSRVFTEAGVSIPVTLVEIKPNRIVQVKTLKKDGYAAIQVTTGTTKVAKLTKPLRGHYGKANVEPGCGLWEVELEHDDKSTIAVGNELKIDMFTEGQKVDVTGISKGKGFAGVIKRYHFSSQDASHGNSLSHRAPGSIGQRQTPGRVFKGKRMAGHLGDAKCTIQNQEIVKIDKESNLLFLKGVIPGAKGAILFIRPTVKKRGKKNGA